ncbi:hypothetical protein [Cellulophaga sp. Hel_I_12]|uniref:hypothetical protein n=1 Tax=Cellulophaga sp. Hel_I_12 TaxID=1249972 RepID=UPI000648C10C|nr:hypothetical protein [Cellulophaga sp. Hel_I_12]
MKDKIYFYIAVTTLVLITATVMASMNFSFSWVFYLTILGQVLLVVMVYKVLRDNYTTTKTFDDFYEDHPISQQENYR